MSSKNLSVAVVREIIDRNFPDQKHLYQVSYTDSSHTRIRVICEKEAMNPKRLNPFMGIRAGWTLEQIPDMFNDVFEIS